MFTPEHCSPPGVALAIPGATSAVTASTESAHAVLSPRGFSRCIVELPPCVGKEIPIEARSSASLACRLPHHSCGSVKILVHLQPTANGLKQADCRSVFLRRF